MAGFDRPAGQALLIGASVLTGVLLAVIGQVFQTGADAFELFLVWTVLILPWTLASRSAAHWLVWLVVACTAVSLVTGLLWSRRRTRGRSSGTTASKTTTVSDA